MYTNYSSNGVAVALDPVVICSAIGGPYQ